MKDELQKEIMKNYPKIFRDKDEDMTRTCMCWGLECPDAWAPLIERLCDSLQFHSDHNGAPQVVADQVKEKFGTLRFYYHTEYPEGAETDPRREGMLAGIVMTYEDMTETICAECGSNKGVTSTKGWITYLCGECMVKRSLK